MEHFRISFSAIIGVVAIVCLMAILAVSACIDSPAFKAGLCNAFVQCDISQKSLPRPDASQMPTLAPPRAGDLSAKDGSLQALLIGQPVYVQVKTDRADIEVGWAPGEFMGR